MRDRRESAASRISGGPSGIEQSVLDLYNDLLARADGSLALSSHAPIDALVGSPVFSVYGDGRGFGSVQGRYDTRVSQLNALGDVGYNPTLSDNGHRPVLASLRWR